MSQPIYCGRGTKVPYADFMDLINLAFGFTEPERQFYGLLPKCYREHFRPQDSNYVVIDENGALTTAVGAYDHELVVCGRRLPCRGIGNVGVHPDHRKKGYMQMAMNQALEDMVADGIALSTLGGRRQRYQYFGYDKAGPMRSFTISPQNNRHLFGDRATPFATREITDPADPAIDEILALNAAQPVMPVRQREQYLDIANSWKAKLLVFTLADRFVGYCVMDHWKSVSEIQVVHSEEFMDVMKSLYDYLGGEFSVNLVPYQTDYINILTPVAEGLSQGIAMHFNILNYRLVTEACLALKLTYTPLPDGELSFLIHGYAGDERILVTVKNGESSVTTLPESHPVDYELSHLQALAFLYSPFSVERDLTPNITAKLWFPLPICMFRADEV